MCGIAGFCNFAGDIKKNINRMNNILRHRGPDGSGVWMTEQRDVVFGHRRMKILDLAGDGVQPMRSASGRYILIFDGGIDNHRKLADRSLYDDRLSGYRSTSAAVLLAAIENYGLKNALSISKGAFALALYDVRERTLTLARDRLGEKPLYYGYVGQTFVFASEINAIKALDGFHNPINTDVLGLYFTHGYIPAPYSIYQGIFKLDAGTVLEIKAPFDKHIICPYWSLRDVAAYGQSNLFKGSQIEAASELERLLRAAIREKADADVPVGAFLSAGIDSSTIVALMKAELNEQVKTFTIGMEYGAEDTAYNEADYAKKIADYLGCRHTEHYISEKDAQAVIPLLASMYGEPFADISQIPTYIVSKLASKKITVSLGGDGGDELFCGYNSYRSVERIYRKLHRVPLSVRRLASRILLNWPFPLSENNRLRASLLAKDSSAELYVNSLEYAPIIREISLTDVGVPYKYSELDPYFLKEPNHQLMLMDLLMYTPDDIMVKVDRAAMASSLECRAPMYDKDVVEFAFSLPIAYKRNNEMGKLVLRDVLYRHVPKQLMERPKQGFGIPIYKWLKEPALKDWAEQLIARDLIVRQGILNPDAVHQIWNDFIHHNQYTPQVWYILMFQSFMAKMQNDGATE